MGDLASDIHLPPEGVSALDLITLTNPGDISLFWADRPRSIYRPAEGDETTQEVWGDLMSPRIIGENPRLKAARYRQLLCNFGLGWGR